MGYGSGVQTLFTQSKPAAHCVHADVHSAPVVFVSAAQLPFGHMWKSALQRGTQAVPSQLTIPFTGAVQVRHDGPQAAAVSLDTQVGAAVVPRRQ